MTRHMTAAMLVLFGAPLGLASGQFGFNSKRETYSVPVSHSAELTLPNVKRIAIAGFVGRFPCSQEMNDHLAEAIVRSGTFELIDPSMFRSALAGQDFQASAFADRSSAARLRQLLGPSAIIRGSVTRCDAEYSAMTSQRTIKDFKGRKGTLYSRETLAHLAFNVQIIDVATAKVVLFRSFAFNPVAPVQATDRVPALVDAREVLKQAVLDADQSILHLLFGWRESISVTVHADKECDLKTSASQIRGGEFTSAAETMQKAIDRQCGMPDDKVALAKAYHNRGIALTYAGKPDEGLKSLQQASSLWPGNISEEAMVATRKVIAARGEQQMEGAAIAEAAAANVQTATLAHAADASLLSNKDVVDMLQAKLSDPIIITNVRTSKCNFDTSPTALIQLKKSGASDAVVLALTEAQCTK